MDRLIDLVYMNPSQKRVLSAVREHATIVWCGSIRSGKGVGAANALLDASITRFLRGVPRNDWIIAGATSGSFQNNNEAYLIDIAAQMGLACKFISGGRSPHYALIADGTTLARFFLFGGGNARSHYSLRGFTAQGAWIDEATLCHQDFVQTAIERCSYDDSWVLMTTNADTPQHWLKTDYVDTGAAYLLETDFRENQHYSDERREIIEQLNPHTSNYARAVGNIWAADEGTIIPILPEHYDDQSRPLLGDVVLDAGTGSITAALLFVPTEYGYQVADEYYWRSERLGRLTDAQHLTNLQQQWGITRLLVDPAAASMKAQANQMGLHPLNAPNDFEAGIQSTNNALYAGRVKVNPQCRNLLMESAGYVWNIGERKPANGVPDHAMDCLRYGSHHLFPTSWSTILAGERTRMVGY